MIIADLVLSGICWYILILIKQQNKQDQELENMLTISEAIAYQS